MDGGEVVISAEALIRIFVLLLYGPVCLFCYWKLIPRLSPTVRRMATGMLVAQVIVIVMSREIRSTLVFEDWLWHLDRESNIPATLASMQLALVAGVALVTAWLARVRPAWQRVYLVWIGLIFLFLAYDEYFSLHEHIQNWERFYAALGAVVTLATAVVAARSLRRTWIWHFCLLTGLAMSATGAMFVGTLQHLCESLGYLRLDGCQWTVYFEESLEFLGIWLTLVAMLGQYSDAAPTSSPRYRLVIHLLPVAWFLFLLVNALIPRIELQFLSRSESIEFESGIYVRSFSVEQEVGAARLKLYATARQPDYIYKGYGIHMVDQESGNSVASHYRGADLHHSIWYFGPDYMSVYRQSMEVVFPPQTPSNRAFSVVLTLWRNLAFEGGKRQSLAILNSDHQLLGETQVVLGELVIPAKSAATSLSTPVAVFDSGFTLESADMPDHAKAGETLAIPFFWRSDVDGSEDFVQFLHFGHEDSDFWWGFDQQPLGARLPTRLWYSGLADSEVWQVPFPADLAPGRYAVYTGLYRLRDQERMPVSDTDGTPFVDARVPLGDITIER